MQLLAKRAKAIVRTPLRIAAGRTALGSARQRPQQQQPVPALLRDCKKPASMWFLEKVRASPGSGGPLSPSFLGLPPGQPVADKSKLGAPAPAFPNILTPDKIPAFCIPPRLVAPPAPKSPSPTFQPHRCLTEPTLQAASAAEGGSGLFLPHLIQVESVEEIPDLEEESTNSDPRSQAALSLPHFPKAQTSYGFCTLLESPHTRRKESIFHSEALVLPLPRSRASSYSGQELASSPIAGHRHPLLGRQGTWDSDTASSAESSPFGSPLLGRSLPRAGFLFKTRSQDGLLGKALRGRGRAGMARAGSLSTDEGSSTDNSPNATRRSSESLLDHLSSRAHSLSPLPIFPLDFPCSRERLGRESIVSMDKGGQLRLSSEYCSENHRLRIRLISVEGLYEASSWEAKSINCCVTFALLPGKLQKQRSTVIKRSRNPIFNEDFFFVGVSEDDLDALSVRMKVVNRGCSMKRDLVLGESEVSLMHVLAA
ncbi:PREDICTED: C2 calcium-dependent domain-containing protein 4C-like [Gekko japonicus]|uniref:C2 calcium-dependent domain-containing protein 4C-like n=1 Tax=Gekko japonicus TaxID=146911 RepID=A0ABM1KPB2_GEKJA|nr:PREDICTED: C2 calcium-dependent domain-containing protein 4C-like [Gekko japonicus]